MPTSHLRAILSPCLLVAAISLCDCSKKPPAHPRALSPLAAIAPHSAAVLWVDHLQAVQDLVLALTTHGLGEIPAAMLPPPVASLVQAANDPNIWRRTGLLADAGAAFFSELPGQAPVLALPLADAAAFAGQVEAWRAQLGPAAAGGTATRPCAGTTLHTQGQLPHGGTVHWAQHASLLLVQLGVDAAPLQATLERLQAQPSTTPATPPLTQKAAWLASGGERPRVWQGLALHLWLDPTPLAAAAPPPAAALLKSMARQQGLGWAGQVGLTAEGDAVAAEIVTGAAGTAPRQGRKNLLRLASLLPEGALLTFVNATRKLPQDTQDPIDSAWGLKVMPEQLSHGLSAAVQLLALVETSDPTARAAVVANACRPLLPQQRRSTQRFSAQRLVVDDLSRAGEKVPLIRLGRWDGHLIVAGGSGSADLSGTVRALRRSNLAAHTKPAVDAPNAPDAPVAVALRQLLCSSDDINSLVQLRLDRAIEALVAWQRQLRPSSVAPTPGVKLTDLSFVDFVADGHRHLRARLGWRP